MRKESGNTSEHDAYMEWEGREVPVQIKHMQWRCDIWFADFFRCARKAHDFILVVGFWETHKNNIIYKRAYYINHQKWNEMLAYEHLDRMEREFREIPKPPLGRELWDKFIDEHYKGYNSSERIVMMRKHRSNDSGGNKEQRIQAAVDYRDFLYQFPKIFRQITLPVVNKRNPARELETSNWVRVLQSKTGANASVCWTGPDAGRMYIGVKIPACNYCYVKVDSTYLEKVITRFNGIKRRPGTKNIFPENIIYCIDTICNKYHSDDVSDLTNGLDSLKISSI